jgi:MYXO-CTERM domain-containing protein
MATLGFSGAARANGLSTHVWITRTARAHVVDPDLSNLVNDPLLNDPLISGTIFPDGGYAVGHSYGEAAHWEPFQHRYLRWIRDQYSPPWSAEARRHIAFLLGLSSHGMADQYFDSLYLVRAGVQDADSDWENNSVDEATDVLFVSKVGKQPVPQWSLPVDALQPMLREAGVQVDKETIERGHSLAGFAIAVVGMLAEDPDGPAGYVEQFPWATTHLQDEAVAGIPSAEAQVVARYWERIWDRLHGRLSPTDVVLDTVPADGSRAHAIDHDAVDSRVTFVFVRRLLTSDVSLDNFSIVSADGAPVTFEPSLFYRDQSHVVHLVLAEDLAPETDYTVTVRAGLKFAEGEVLADDYSLSFSTRVPPEPQSGNVNPGCNCSSPRPPGAPGLLEVLGCVAFLLFVSVRRRRTSRAVVSVVQRMTISANR